MWVSGVYVCSVSVWKQISVAVNGFSFSFCFFGSKAALVSRCIKRQKAGGIHGNNPRRNGTVGSCVQSAASRILQTGFFSFFPASHSLIFSHFFSAIGIIISLINRGVLTAPFLLIVHLSYAARTIL
jgi:hypothetical protein